MLREAEPIADGFATAIADDWLQGRTAYGGLTSALALAVAQRVDPDLPPLCSGQLAMIAPLSGRIEARARIVRRGRNVIWVASELTGANGVGFTATFAFMRPLPSETVIAGYPMPSDVAPVEAASPMPGSREPEFLRNHFDIRVGRAPHPGAACLCNWVRLRDREGLDPAVEALLIGDAMPAGLWPMLDRAVPISSMNWHVNMLTAQPASADGWWLLETVSEAARSGATSERIVQWNSDGDPVIAGMQSVAVFG